MDSRWARVARGTVAATFATFVAAFSHSIAGGSAPSVFGIGVSLILAIALCTLLAGRTLSVWRLAVSVVASQALFHGLFSGLGTPAGMPHHGADSHALHAVVGMGTASSTSTMTLAHLIAALITVIAIRYGESAFWGLGQTFRLLFARLAGILIPLFPHTVAVVVPAPVRVLHSQHLLSSTSRRGPPQESQAL